MNEPVHSHGVHILRHKLLLALSLTTGMTSPALAENWYFVGTAKEEINYADADSLQVNGDIDGLKVFSGSLRGVGPDVDIYYTKVNVEIDCSKHLIRWLGIEAFGDQRQYVTAPDFETDWISFTTDDAAEYFRAFACDGASREQQVSDPFDDADSYFYYYYDEEGAPVEPSSD